MGISDIKLGLLVGAFVLPLLIVSGCQFDKQYLSGETCIDCTICRSKSHEVVIRPCQVHADTICGPISALNLEWPIDKPHDHHKQKEINHKHLNSHVHHHHHHHHNPLHDLTNHDLPILQLKNDPLTTVEEWERLLKESRAQLQHRKEDLMKSLLERKNAAKRLHHKDWNEDEMETESHLKTEESSTTYRPHISKLEIFEKLLRNEMKIQNKRPLEELSAFDEHLPRDDDQKHKNDLRDEFPALYDFMAVVPTHRLFLGEPSTIPEMMINHNLQLEESVSSERVPFTAAETFVWDWQAVALISAIAACLLFFALAAIYSILHARQWRRIKSHFNIDVEDLALRVSLMQNGGSNVSSPDVSNTNHYLEQLIAEKKLGENKSNFYIEKQPS